MHAYCGRTPGSGSGNHDYLQEGSLYLTFPWKGNVHFFTEPTIRPYFVKEQNVCFYGMSYRTQEILEPVFDELQILKENGTNEDTIHILLAHGGDGRHIPYVAERILEKGIDYIAGGHLHTRRVPAEHRAVIPGPLQPTEPKEIGDFGYWMVTIEKKNGAKTQKAQFFPLYEERGGKNLCE